MYYIVINEWNYPTESGREFIGDFDTLEEAREASKKEYENEYDNFLDVNQEVYAEACGEIVDENNSSIGYMLCSSQYEEENKYFWSRIISVKEVS